MSPAYLFAFDARTYHLRAEDQRIPVEEPPSTPPGEGRVPIDEPDSEKSEQLDIAA